VLVERAVEVSAERVEGRWLVVDPDGRAVVTLSPTGSLVWDAIDGRRDLAAIARRLVEQTVGGTVEQAERDVAAFVAELLDAGLVRRLDAPG